MIDTQEKFIKVEEHGELVGSSREIYKSDTRDM